MKKNAQGYNGYFYRYRVINLLSYKYNNVTVQVYINFAYFIFGLTNSAKMSTNNF